MRARGEECGEGGDGGAGMMQCLATGVRARTRRGRRWWWEVRGGGEDRERGKRAERQLPMSNGPNGCPS